MGNHREPAAHGPWPPLGCAVWESVCGPEAACADGETTYNFDMTLRGFDVAMDVRWIVQQTDATDHSVAGVSLAQWKLLELGPDLTQGIHAREHRF